MGGASSWYSILFIAIFLFAVWGAGKAAKKIGISSIILEVGVGLILGEKVLGLIPSELSGCYHDSTIDCNEFSHQKAIADKGTEFCDLQAYLDKDKYTPGANWRTGFWGEGDGGSGHKTVDGKKYDLTQGAERRLAGGKEGKTDFDSYTECLKESCGLDLALKCATTPDIFTLVGHTGVAMMIFESGMHFNFEQAKTVGPPACVVAVLGTFLPIIFGSLLTVAFGFKFFPDGLSVGVSLSPTSIGIALRLLHEVKALSTTYGQTVMTAAFVDDVLALICFSVLFSLQGDITFFTFLPLICGCVFMAVAIVACVKFWPFFLKWIFEKIPETKPDAKLTRHDEVYWLLMFFTLAVYAQITHLCGTHLWGCFIAGMCFSHDHHAHHVWVRQVKRLTCWFMRLFFASTLAWAIPVNDLFSIEAFWKGTLMGIGPCILTKVFCGPFVGPSRWVVGWAMVGRAEFAYFIAIMAKSVKMMEDKVFAIIIWALVYATIFAPLVFRKVLARYIAQTEGYPPKMTNKACRMSGHLPDFEEEQLEEMHRQLSKDAESMHETLQFKDEEIARLKEEVEMLKKKKPADVVKQDPEEADEVDENVNWRNETITV